MTRKQIGTADVVRGVAEAEWDVPSNETVGTRILYATYVMNDEYMTAEAYNNAVIRIPTTTTVYGMSGQNTTTQILGSVGETVRIYADVKFNTDNNVDAGGVQFIINKGTDDERPINTTYATLSNGTAYVDYKILDGDSTGDTITAVYNRGGDYENSESSTPATFKIREASNVVVSPQRGNRGDTVSIVAAITDSDGDEITQGDAQLYIDNTAVGQPVSVSEGSVTFSYDISNNEVVGSHTVKVTYGQTGDYDPSEGTSTLTVRNPTTLTSETIYVNRGQQDVPVVIQVRDSLNQNVSSGTVNITVGSGIAQSAQVTGGEAQILFDVPNDAAYGSTISFTAAFVEDNTYQGSTMANNGVISVRKALTMVVNDIDAVLGQQDVTLSATVDNTDGTPVTSGTVNFEIE